MNYLNINEPEIIGIAGGVFNGCDGMFSNHLSSIIDLPAGGHRIYLCRRFWFDDKTTSMDIGYCDSDSLTQWPNLQEKFKPLKLEGLPDNCKTAHPNIIKKANSYEMFCWVHGSGMVRYVKCSSRDGINFKIENLAEPCLYHPADFAVAENDDAQGLLTVKNHCSTGNPVDDSRTRDIRHELISNDATCVIYDNQTGQYVMHTVHLMPSELLPERIVPYDNAPKWLRVIHRRTSNDGLTWSNSVPVFVPDENDPVDLQFYSLVTRKAGPGMIGILGYYPVKDQVLDLLPAVCDESGCWRRNREPWHLREKISLDGKPVKMIFPGAIVQAGSDLIISGTCCSYLHNQVGKLAPEEYVQANALFRLPLANIQG